MCLYLTDLLNVQCHIHVNTSKLTATISWTYRGDKMKVNSWKLRVRNLTWEQNDYSYDEKVFIIRDRGAFTRLPTVS